MRCYRLAQKAMANIGRFMIMATDWCNEVCRGHSQRANSPLMGALTWSIVNFECAINTSIHNHHSNLRNWLLLLPLLFAVSTASGKQPSYIPHIGACYNRVDRHKYPGYILREVYSRWFLWKRVYFTLLYSAHCGYKKLWIVHVNSSVRIEEQVFTHSHRNPSHELWRMSRYWRNKKPKIPWSALWGDTCKT